jgi:hypothetical protein
MYLRFILSSRLASLPRPLLEKVLNDVLVEWARQVATQKGSLKYQLDLLTPNVILKDTLNTQTTLIRYDLLRRHVGRAMSQLAVVTALPGASTIRVGEGNFSLTDLRTNLADLLEFQLNPLIRRRLIYALTPAEASLNVLYLEDRVLELRRIRETADTRPTQLQAALQTFTAESASSQSASTSGEAAGAGAISTQLSDTFLDRLIDIAGQSGAMEYRQDLTNRIIAAGEEGLQVDQDIAFYQETLRLLREAMRGARPEALRPEDVTEAFDAIQARVIETLELTSEAYERVSESTLNPRTTLYRIVGPFSVRTVAARSAQSLATTGAAAVVISIMFLLGFIVVRGMFVRQLPVTPGDRGSRDTAA